MAQVLTFGCKLNTYETEIIKQKASKAELGDDVFILNTCSVTLEAEKDAIKKIRKIKKENPDAKILVTGCGAQVNSEKFAKMEEVNFVFGNKEKLEDEAYNAIQRGKSFIQKTDLQSEESERHEDKIFFKERGGAVDFNEKVMVNDIMSIKETASHMVVTDFENHTRAFVQIQNGCNHRCTFCIIPFARGNSRSVPFGKLFTEINTLVENGYKEIVLTGVDITDYGKDLPGELTLGKMSKRLLKLIPNLKRLRFSSIDVAEIDRDIYELIANEPRFMPHFHISLQSGDDLILKRMKRRHARGDVLNFVKQAKALREEVTFGADIISGFPTETEENFLNSKNLIEEAELSFCHIFSFSPHTGTPASKMPQVAKEVIKARTNLLIAAGKHELNKTLQKMIGKTYEVLFESENMGRCENFTSGIFANKATKGEMLTLKVIGFEAEKLIFS
jgi:threonylcarbamoyladenosine tRNA methylthiotransferase MtaB